MTDPIKKALQAPGVAMRTTHVEEWINTSDITTQTIITTTTTTVTTTTTTISERVDVDHAKDILATRSTKDKDMGISGHGAVKGEAHLRTSLRSDQNSPPLSSVSVPQGENQETHCNIPYTSFIKNVLNDDDLTFTSLGKVSLNLIEHIVFQKHHQEYLDAVRGVPDSPIPEESLMKLFNCIIKLAPACGLQQAYPLDIDFIARGYGVKNEVPYCAALLHEGDTSEKGVWPVIMVRVHPPVTAPLVTSLFRSEDRTRQQLPSRLRQKSRTQFDVTSSAEIPDIAHMTRDAFKIMARLGTRRHILGIVVQGFDMFMCYLDRAGSIRSSRLHLIHDVRSAVEAIASFALCSPAQLGFEPCIHPPPPLPLATSISGSYIDIQGQRLILDGLLHSPDYPFGRGTVVFSAHPSSTTSAVGVPNDVIVKLSWQDTTQESEDELFRHAAKHNVDGVAKLYLSSVVAKLSDGVRRNVMRSKKYVDRELRIQVMGPRCMPLYQVVELEDFKAAFISLVKAHHDLYQMAGILHRDISINNLMVDPSNPRIGVLIDFDLAAVVKDSEGNEIDVKPILTGTTPFLAIDLLRSTPVPKSYYRHDLESFLYVLVWITSHYDRGEEVPTDTLQNWHRQDWEIIATAKLGYISSDQDGFATPHYQSLETTWIRQLRFIFSDGYTSKVQHELKAAGGRVARGQYDYETLGGHVTYAEVMDILLHAY